MSYAVMVHEGFHQYATSSSAARGAPLVDEDSATTTAA
jgi:hypothetical protein